MLKRIITARPAISLTTALVGLVCLFFIAAKENQIKTEREKAVHFQQKNRADALTSLLPPNEYTPKQLLDLQYRKVELAGVFLPNQEIFVANRTAANDAKPTSKKVPGFHIMSPFALTTGQIVWVNRGWIARDPANRKNIPTIEFLEGIQTITGYVQPNRPDSFEVSSTMDHKVDGRVIALNFHVPTLEKDTLFVAPYPFLIIQTGVGGDRLIRPSIGYIQEVNYSFEVQNWWFILIFTFGFWFISGLIFLKRQGNPLTSGRLPSRQAPTQQGSARHGSTD